MFLTAIPVSGSTAWPAESRRSRSSMTFWLEKVRAMASTLACI